MSNLYESAASGNLSEVRKWIAKGEPLSWVKQPKNWSALHIAAAKGHTPIVKLLLEQGASVEKRSLDDMTPVMLAVEKGYMDTLVVFLEYKPDLETVDSRGWNIFHMAVLNDSLDMCTLLLDRHARFLNMKSTKEYMTPLMHASHRGHLRLVQFLLDRGADVQAVSDDRHFSALHYISDGIFKKSNNPEVMKLLLERKADPNAKTKEKAQTPLMFAAKQDLVPLAKLLLEYKAHIAAKDVDGKTALLIAVEESNVGVVEVLLERNADVNAKDNSGWTGLMFAAKNKHTVLVEMLLGKGAKAGLRNEKGETALSIAEKFGYKEIMELLINGSSTIQDFPVVELDNKKDDTKGDPFGAAKPKVLERPDPSAMRLWTDRTGKFKVDAALEEIVGNNVHLHKFNGVKIAVPLEKLSLGDIEYLRQNTGNLSLGAASTAAPTIPAAASVAENVIESPDSQQISSQNLYRVAGEGDISQVRYWIRKTASVHWKNKERWCALHNAASAGHTQVVRILLENDANVNAQTLENSTPLMLAAQNGHIDVVRLLLSNKANIHLKTLDGWTAILFAASNGYVDIVNLLIECGGDVNDANTKGLTLLMSAVKKGNLEMVNFLLEKKADLHKKKNDGWNAFMFAAKDGSLDMLKFLVQKGARLNEMNIAGGSALSIAAGHRNIDAVKFLLEKKADIHIKSPDGPTVLTSAAEGGSVDIIRLLLGHGADINETDDSGWSPLIIAVLNGHIDAAEFLLTRKSDVNQWDVKDQTALYLALIPGAIEEATRKHDDYRVKDMVKLLLDFGADINVVNNDGRSVMQLAEELGDQDVIQLLRSYQAKRAQMKSSSETKLIASAEPPQVNNYEPEKNTTHVNASMESLKGPSLRQGAPLGDFVVVKLIYTAPTPESPAIYLVHNDLDEEFVAKVAPVLPQSQNQYTRLSHELNMIKMLATSTRKLNLARNRFVELILSKTETSFTYMIMPKYDITLHAWAEQKRQSCFNTEEFLYSVKALLLGQLIPCLEHLESCGIVHGDLKAENFMAKVELGVGASKWVLIDFDAAQQAGTLVSSPRSTYFPPEYGIAHDRGEPVKATFAVDWWGLGCMVCDMLSGFVFWEDHAKPTFDQWKQTGLTAPYFPDGIPTEVRNTICKYLLLNDPSQRSLVKFKNSSVMQSRQTGRITTEIRNLNSQLSKMQSGVEEVGKQVDAVHTDVKKVKMSVQEIMMGIDALQHNLALLAQETVPHRFVIIPQRGHLINTYHIHFGCEAPGREHVLQNPTYTKYAEGKVGKIVFPLAKFALGAALKWASGLSLDFLHDAFPFLPDIDINLDPDKLDSMMESFDKWYQSQLADLNAPSMTVTRQGIEWIKDIILNDKEAQLNVSLQDFHGKRYWVCADHMPSQWSLPPLPKVVKSESLGSRQSSQVTLPTITTMTPVNIVTISASDPSKLQQDLFDMTREGSINLVTQLLDQGADVNTCDTSGATPLMVAVQRGFVDIARLLIVRKANVNKKDHKGSTALMFAASQGRIEMVQLLLDSGATLQKTGALFGSKCVEAKIAKDCGHVHLSQFILSHFKHK